MSAPTKEQLKAEHDQAVQVASDRMFNTAKYPVTQPVKAAEPVPPAEPPKPPETPPEPPKEEKPPAPAPTSPTPPAQPPTPEPKAPSIASLPKPTPTLDKETVREVVASALEEAGVKPTPAAPAGPSLLPKEQKMVDVFRKMESMNPAYKGLAENVIAFWAKEQTWIADWEKANPDKEFSDNNEDYVAWCKKNEPPYDDDDYDSAKEALSDDRITARVEKKVETKERAANAQEKLAREAPLINQVAHATVSQMVANTFLDKDGKLPEAIAQIISKDGKMILIDDAAAQKLSEEAPLEYRVLLEEGEALNILTTALETMKRFEETNPTDQQRNSMARQLDAATRLKFSGHVIRPVSQLDVESEEVEREMLKAPKEQMLDGEGRTFVSQAEFYSEVKAIKNSALTPEKKKASLERLSQTKWCLGADELRVALMAKFAGKVKERVASLDEVLDRKAKKKSAPASPEPPKPAEVAPATPPVEPAPAAGKQKSPATVSRSDTPDNSKGPLLSKEQQMEVINKKMWG